MAISSLPDGRSPTLDVVPATQEEMLGQCQKNGVSWRGALSMEAYLRREAYLAKSSLSRDGGLTGWVLIDTAADERFVLAGCETLRKRAWISMNGEVKEVICHGIGSVFCPVECRRRGYGARLMAELGKKLGAWQVTEKIDTAISVLYSDIGKKFYATLGWRPYPSAHVEIPSSKASPEDEPERTGLPPVQPLFAGDLPSLCARDEVLVRQKLASMEDQIAMAIIPDLATMEWHLAREDFVSNELYGKKPFIKGAMVTDETGYNRVWCIWSRVWHNEDSKDNKGNTMHILRLVVEEQGGNISANGSASANGQHPAQVQTASNQLSPDLNGTSTKQIKEKQQVAAIAALLLVARQEAFRWKMQSVQIWNPDSRTLLAVQRLDPLAKVVQRDEESIASLRLHGQQDDREVEWINNEKYAWC